MPAPAYRKASRQTFVWLFICLAGVAGQIAVMIQPGMKSMGPWVFLWGSLPFFLGLALALWVCRGLKRGRFRKVSARLEEMGFLVSTGPDKRRKRNSSRRWRT